MKNDEIGIKIQVCRICSSADQRALRKGWPHCRAESPENRNGHCTGFSSLKPRKNVPAVAEAIV